jgi:hypothetical protein
MVFTVPLKGKNNRAERGAEQLDRLRGYIQGHAGLRAGYERGDFDLYVEGVNIFNGEVPTNVGNTIIKVNMEDQKCFAPVIEWILFALGGAVREESCILFKKEI